MGRWTLGACCVLWLSATFSVDVHPQEAIDQISQTYEFSIPRSLIAGTDRVPIDLFDPKLGILREAVVDIQGNLSVGANTTPSIVGGVPVPYLIGFTLTQTFEGPFTVGQGDWTNLEGKFIYEGTAPGTGGYVGFEDRAFSYRVVINESTDLRAMAVPEALGPDIAPGPVGGMLSSFVSSEMTEGYVSWVAALLGGEDINMDAGHIYFPMVGATGTITITYHYQAEGADETPPVPLAPDTSSTPPVPPEPVPVPHPIIGTD